MRRQYAPFTLAFFAALTLVAGCVKTPVVTPVTLKTAAQPVATMPTVTPPTAENDEPVPAEVAPAACEDDMVEVKGDYCPELTHYCLEGYAGIGAPFKKYPGGATGIEFCTKFVVGKSECKGEPKPMHFCADKYEYPNREGAIPRVLVTWTEADRLCKADGKRLCDDDEWTLACEGPERLPYPYGWERDATACNIDRPIPDVNRALLHSTDPAVVAGELLRIERRTPSGAMARCVSPFGLYDTTGNVDEWTRNITLHGQPYVSMFKGGHMIGSVRNRCRPNTAAHSPQYDDFTAGFRCCAAAR